ncbi:hypothetical protein JCM8097_000426 [Rhodosporidiobolus ruineniae]
MSALEIKADEGHIVEKENAPNGGNAYAVEVSFAKDDPLNPQEGWGALKRWRVLFVALFITFTSTYNSAGNGSVGEGVEKEFGVSAEIFQVSSFAYQLMLGVGPLLLAPLSETFGRRPMLVTVTALITLLFLPQALAPNFASICATRFFQGIMGSVEGPVIAGLLADLFPKVKRGRAMGVFVVSVYAGNACGPSISAWVAYKLSWRWVYWLQMIMSGCSCILTFFFLPETRGELILSKRANALTEESGIQHYIRGAHKARSFIEGVKLSSTRPLLYLFTEPIVTMCALWIGFAWGVTFLGFGATALVFSDVYGFNAGLKSTPVLTGLIGALFGFVENELIQEPLYRCAVQRGGGRAQPEARLYSSAAGALMFAVGFFGFAWTARPWIPWIAPAIFLTFSQFGLYMVYLATYNYLSDTYERYSSSAQAAQSLLRGFMGACFPFFGNKMYENLGYPYASTLVGGIGLIFVGVPLLMLRYGPALRQRSKVAMELSHLEGEVLRDEPVVVA